MVREVGGHYDYQVQPNSLTTVTARVGRSTSKGSDTSGKSGLSTFPKQRDETEHWRRIGRGHRRHPHLRTYRTYSLISPYSSL